MSNRFNLGKAEPAAFKAMMDLSKYVEDSGIDKGLLELIKVRASQINGCAFCIDMHTHDARKHGETEQRLYALSAWHDAPFFSEHERAALTLTEEITLIQGKVSDETYSKAAMLFTEQQLAQILMAIVMMNSWNRIAITTGLEPAVR